MHTAIYRSIYIACAVVLLTTEIVAAWLDKRRGDTITEMARSANLPAFIWCTFGVFFLLLALHFMKVWKF